MYPLSPIATIPVFTRFRRPFPVPSAAGSLHEVECALRELEAFHLEQNAIGAGRKISRELEAIEGVSVTGRHPVRKAGGLGPLGRNQEPLQQHFGMLRKKLHEHIRALAANEPAGGTGHLSPVGAASD